MSCVCEGGELNPCEECAGTTIQLHDDEEKFVRMRKCPYVADWSQESYLVNFYGHYANQQQPMAITDWPYWVEQGIAVLSHLKNIEHDQQMKKPERDPYYGS